MRKHLVVVGGGQAAVQAVQTARTVGFNDMITLVGAEPCRPYQRPPLSKKYLAGSLERERLFLKPLRFYEDRAVQLELGIAVTSIERAQQVIELADGRRFAYDHLLLATGARPRKIRVPGAELQGVHYLRTIADVEAIAADVRRRSRVVVVGGGYIGLEVASVCVELGLDVTVLEAAGRLLQRVVCAETAAFYEGVHRQAGVGIHCDALVSAFMGRSHVEKVLTTDGREFDCDCVIIGIGVEPNTELASAAGLACSDGIAVDARGLTEDPLIAAAGDCTSQPHPWIGKTVRLESVHNAIEQSKAAIKSLLGAPTEFSEIPWFWSDQYDLKLQIAGFAADYDATVVRGNPNARSFAVYYLRDGRPIAVDAINSPRDFLIGKKLLARRPVLAAAAIADTDTDLRAFLAAG